MSTARPAESTSGRDGPPSLVALLDELAAPGSVTLVHSATATMSLDDLRAAVRRVAAGLTRAGAGPGAPIGSLVGSGASGIVSMFAVWSIGGVYLPINERSTAAELGTITAQTPIAVLLGTPTDLERLLPMQTEPLPGFGIVELDTASWTATVRRAADRACSTYDPGIALILRTSGTTGRPKAVLLRHGGTIDALDSSLRKHRRRPPPHPGAPLRVTLIPLSLALWSGIFTTLFALRAGFGVVLLERFSPDGFAALVRLHRITSTVLAPAMITMLCDAEHLGSLAPLRTVRSITAPLSPATAHRFRERFGVLVLNSYGQTELGGEVVGWTVEDARRFGTAKLGATGRAHEGISVSIVDDDDRELGLGRSGHVLVRSPFRMEGYADLEGAADDERMVNGYLRTGDIGHLDEDRFLWIDGRAGDMINRGGLKIFPDEVEEVLRRHAGVREVVVAGVPDDRLGEVPHAWIVPEPGTPVDPVALTRWCREHLAAYKVPLAFTAISALPRSEVGKVLRRTLSTSP